MKKFIIPSRFQNVDYEKDVSALVKNTVENFEKTRKGLYLFGNAGTGKTHTAYAICDFLQKKGFQVMAFKAVDILKMIREDMNFENKNEDFEYNGDAYFKKTDSFRAYPINFLEGIIDYRGFLFIDDFGTEKGTEWVLETFYTIIDKKYEDMIPTIITSNCTMYELGSKMGDRIASRIAQMCDIIDLTGKDRRVGQ